ncbi:MAG: outer membrane protein transport protein [Alphaproteobacteria bacterium]|nr:outer membrane protein transport protein [Alphaproteobacteria bacterium]
MKKLLLGIAALACVSEVQAGGFQLSEYSSTSIGRAFAGAGIVGDDLSAMAFNPAGMTLSKSGIQAGVSFVSMYSNVHGSVSNGAAGPKGKIRENNIVPHAFVQYAPTDDLRIGAGIYTPYAFSLDYNEGWFGRGHARKSEIKAIDYALVFSYKVMSWASIGVGVQAQTLDARLTNNVDAAVPYGFSYMSDLKGDSFNVTGIVGVMFEPDKNTRFGVSYQMKSNHKIKGDHHVSAGMNLYGDVHAKLVLPEFLLISGYHKMDKLGLSASAKWTRWSQFKTLDVYSSYTGKDRPVGAVHENWRNTWTLSVGADYDINDKTTVRTGLAYDQTGIKDCEHRTARLPDANRWILGVGGSYRVTDKMTIDAAYAHMFMKTSKTANTLPNGGSKIDAKYKSQINIFSVAIQYHF